MATAFVHGLGLTEGAIATTYNHLWFNLLVVGVDEEDMAIACNELEKIGGGFVVVQDRKVSKELALPFGGVATDRPVDEVAQEFDSTRKATETIGCKLHSPFLTLAFCTLPSIPDCGITDLGLIDSSTMELVDLIIK
jgi:adenine deaminase